MRELHEPVDSLDVYSTQLDRVDFWLGQVLVETREVHPGANKLVFTIPRAKLAGVLSSLTAEISDAETGRPLDCRVVLAYSNQPHNRSSYGTVGSHLALNCLDSGEAEIAITAPGHATRWFRRTLLPGKPTDLGDVRLERELTIRGTVKGPRLHETIVVSAREFGGSLLPEPDAFPVTWAGDDSFEIHGLSNSTYLVRISGPYLGRALTVDTQRASGPILLETRPYANVYVSSRESDERFIHVHIQDKEGLPVHTISLAPTNSRHQSWCRLEYGSYDLVCDDGGSPLGTRSILVDSPKLDVVIE